MKNINVGKVTVNFGVGEGGERLAKAENLLEQLTGQKPVRTYSKVTNPTFGIRKGLPIGCKVTLRKERADKFLKMALDAKNFTLKKSNFDEHGNLSFGIAEHIDLPGVKYDPNVGIFGMDISITLERPGYRIKKRKLKKMRISKDHEIKKEDAAKFMEENYKVKVEE